MKSKMNKLKQTDNINTRREILDQARILFFKKGYDRTTLDDISRPLGFETPNLYNYYRSKEQLLYEVIKDAHLQVLSLARSCIESESDDPVEQLRMFVNGCFEVVVNWTEYNNVTVETDLIYLSSAHRRKILRMREEYTEILRTIIRKGVKSHKFLIADEKLAATFIASIIMRGALWFSQAGELSSGEVSKVIFKFVLHGLKR